MNRALNDLPDGSLRIYRRILRVPKELRTPDTGREPSV